MFVTGKNWGTPHAKMNFIRFLEKRFIFYRKINDQKPQKVYSFYYKIIMLKGI